MKTTLYNTTTNQTVGKIREGSFNGIWNSVMSKQQGWLPDHIIELTVVETDQPEYDPETQRISNHWIADIEEELYTQEWTVEDIPQEEIAYNNALQDWPHPGWRKRIVAPIALAIDDIGAKMYVWFRLNGFPVGKANDTTIHLYCNLVLPEHQAIVDSLGETVTIQDRPEILNPDI